MSLRDSLWDRPEQRRERLPARLRADEIGMPRGRASHTAYLSRWSAGHGTQGAQSVPRRSKPAMPKGKKRNGFRCLLAALARTLQPTASYSPVVRLFTSGLDRARYLLAR